MGHSEIAFANVAPVRDDIIRLLLVGLADYANEIENESEDRSWILAAVRSWKERQESSAPGAVRIDLELWIDTDERKRAFIDALDWVDRNAEKWIPTETLKMLRTGRVLNFADIREIVSRARLPVCAGASGARP